MDKVKEIFTTLVSSLKYDTRKVSKILILFIVSIKTHFFKAWYQECFQQTYLLSLNINQLNCTYVYL